MPLINTQSRGTARQDNNIYGPRTVNYIIYEYVYVLVDVYMKIYESILESPIHHTFHIFFFFYTKFVWTLSFTLLWSRELSWDWSEVRCKYIWPAQEWTIDELHAMILIVRTTCLYGPQSLEYQSRKYVNNRIMCDKLIILFYYL